MTQVREDLQVNHTAEDLPRYYLQGENASGFDIVEVSASSWGQARRVLSSERKKRRMVAEKAKETAETNALRRVEVQESLRLGREDLQELTVRLAVLREAHSTAKATTTARHAEENEKAKSRIEQVSQQLDKKKEQGIQLHALHTLWLEKKLTLAQKASHQIGASNSSRMRSMIVRVDPIVTEGRFEWMLVKHDVRFAPQRAWHFEVHWLPCTAVFVDELVTVLMRWANRLQLPLLQVPSRSKSDSTGFMGYASSPFSVIHTINLINGNALKMVEDGLTTMFSFVLSGAHTEDDADLVEYLHHTGMASIRIDHTINTLQWQRNRLASASVHSAQASQLYRDIREHCEDVNGRFAKWSLQVKDDNKDA